MKRHRLSTAGVAIAFLIVGVGSAAAGAVNLLDVAQPPEPDAGHSEVIAQSVVDLGDGPYHWNVTEHPIDSTGTELFSDTYTFFVAGGDIPVLFTGANDGVRLLLGHGEGVFRDACTTAQARTFGGAATLTRLALGTEAADAAGALLTPGAGPHDLDLRRDVLAPGETFSVDVAIPAFILVTEGSVASDGVSIGAGGTALLEGAVALTNEGAEPAAVLVATLTAIPDLPVVAPPVCEQAPGDPGTPGTPQPITSPPDTTTDETTTTTTTSTTTTTDPILVPLTTTTTTTTTLPILVPVTSTTTTQPIIVPPTNG